MSSRAISVRRCFESQRNFHYSKLMSALFNTPPQATGYLLLFRGSDWAEKDGMSEDEINQVIERVNAWFEGLSTSGKLLAAQPLFDESVFISGKGGRSVTDGPFAEAKESVGGYVLLSVSSFEEAVAIAKTNPMHDLGVTTEVRTTASSCPHVYRFLSRFATAAA
jgi:hypothetical protein